jgi:hypothetical protein
MTAGGTPDLTPAIPLEIAQEHKRQIQLLK